MTYRLRLCQLSLAAIVLAASLSCSKSPAEYIAAGDKYFAQGLINEALVEYRGAVLKDPMSGEARKKLAAAFERSGDAGRALREYVKAADLLPDDAGVKVKAGVILLRAKKFEEAKARAQQALVKDPRNIEAQHSRQAR